MTATAIRANASFHSTHHALALGAGSPHGQWQAGSWAQRSGVTCPEPGCRCCMAASPLPGPGSKVAAPVGKPFTCSSRSLRGHRLLPFLADSTSFVTQLHSQHPLQSPWGQAVASLPPEPRWCLPHGCFGPRGSHGSILTMARCQARAPYAVQVVQTDGSFSGS